MNDFSNNGSISRREMLRRSAAGFGNLALLSLLAESGFAQVKPDPLAPKRPHFEPKAKRVIFLFMHGGPSHVDTFDEKPLLTRDHGKPLPFAKPRVQFSTTRNLLKSHWEFTPRGQCGMPVSSLFPQVSTCVDDIAFINSMYGSNAAHGGALLKLHTGSDNFIRPSMGSWINYGLGTENRNLPGFVTICPTSLHGGVYNYGSAFLPAAYHGISLGTPGYPNAPVENAQFRFTKNTRLNRDQQLLQLELLREMNRKQLDETGPDTALEGRIHSFELAFRMQRESAEVLNTSRETAATKTLYGIDKKESSNFGMQCLLARRFAERGVRFIQVTHSQDRMPQEQWDQHSNMKFCLERNCAEIDQPVAGLLKDLKSRGMLHDTLVIWGGEFGRTPTAQNTDGRDHNPEGFTMWMAGGGVKGGLRYGATDDYGYYAAENKVHVHDLHATILHLLGLNHERLTYRYGGRDFRLTDVHGEIVHGILA